MNRYIQAILICFTCVGILCAPYLVVRFLYGNFFDFSETGQIGDTIGGLTAPFIGLLSAILVYAAFRQQLDANRMQSNALKLSETARIDDVAVSRFTSIVQGAEDFLKDRKPSTISEAFYTRATHFVEASRTLPHGLGDYLTKKNIDDCRNVVAEYAHIYNYIRQAQGSNETTQFMYSQAHRMIVRYKMADYLQDIINGCVAIQTIGRSTLDIDRLEKEATLLLAEVDNYLLNL